MQHNYSFSAARIVLNIFPIFHQKKLKQAIFCNHWINDAWWSFWNTHQFSRLQHFKVTKYCRQCAILGKEIGIKWSINISQWSDLQGETGCWIIVMTFQVRTHVRIPRVMTRDNVTSHHMTGQGAVTEKHWYTYTSHHANHFGWKSY